MTAGEQTLRHVPLEPEHVALGASLVGFGGWAMPVRYVSDLAEHHAVRTAAGLFDVSHMGRVELTGPDATAVLDRTLVSRVHDLAVGRARYTMLCSDDGEVVDDLIVTRLDDRLLVVPNASNTDAVLAVLRAAAISCDATITHRTGHVLLALQGPAAADVLRAALDAGTGGGTTDPASSLRPFRAARLVISGADVIVSRTGYTGEDGFELACDGADEGRAVWGRLLEVGAPQGLVPCGLAARDTLRLEAGLPLHGHELDGGLGPFETGFARIVHLDDGRTFPGRSALERTAATGPARRVVGLLAEGRRAPRPGYDVLLDGRVVGTVTSGAPSPTLGVPIALAAVEAGLAEVGTALTVDVRGSTVAAQIVRLPFVTRGTARAD